MKALGIVLIVAGVALMIITGINVTREEKLLDLGKVEINKKKTTPISWSPIIGGILLVGGIAVLLTAKKTA
ncbi:MAG: hypothetical protein M3R17_04175 [Bacteroidota bacterium]|nr:hypothetical protein [Bacteroidota bacterium]